MTWTYVKYKHWILRIMVDIIAILIRKSAPDKDATAVVRGACAGVWRRCLASETSEWPRLRSVALRACWSHIRLKFCKLTDVRLGIAPVPRNRAGSDDEQQGEAPTLGRPLSRY